VRLVVIKSKSTTMHGNMNVKFSTEPLRVLMGTRNQVSTVLVSSFIVERYGPKSFSPALRIPLEYG
jgi:hypothetical protein